MKKDIERTPRGFVIFGHVPFNHGGTDATIRVQESSAAGTGAHCWLFIDGAECNDHLGHHQMPNPHMSVAQAKQLIGALQDFVDAAEGDELTEPAEGADDEGDEADDDGEGVE